MPRETSKTEDRVLARECAWCGEAFVPKPRAKHQRYCARSCRQRAYEVRTAEERQERDIEQKDARDPRDPIRELVERHTVRTVVRTVQGPIHVVERPAPARPATRGREIQDDLEDIAERVRTRQVGHWDHARVWRGVEALLVALDHAHPGGLEALRRRR